MMQLLLLFSFIASWSGVVVMGMTDSPTYATPAPTAVCKYGGTYVDGQCFVSTNENFNQGDCLAECGNRFSGGHLPCVRDSVDNDAILDLATGDLWLAYARTGPSSFDWPNYCPLGVGMFVFFRPDNPSNSGGNENCVELDWNFFPGMWNDQECTDSRLCVCQYAP